MTVYIEMVALWSGIGLACSLSYLFGVVCGSLLRKGVRKGGRRMDYLKEAEKYLKRYRHLVYSIENIKREIASVSVSGGPREIMAVPVGRSRGSSKVHDAMNDIYRLQILIDCQKETSEMIGRIITILDHVSEDYGCENYGKLLRLWYIGIESIDREGKTKYKYLSKEEICEMLGYSRKSRESLYVKRNDALERFAVELFGIRALEAQ